MWIQFKVSLLKSNYVAGLYDEIDLEYKAFKRATNKFKLPLPKVRRLLFQAQHRIVRKPLYRELGTTKLLTKPLYEFSITTDLKALPFQSHRSKPSASIRAISQKTNHIATWKVDKVQYARGCVFVCNNKIKLSTGIMCLRRHTVSFAGN